MMTSDQNTNEDNDFDMSRKKKRPKRIKINTSVDTIPVNSPIESLIQDTTNLQLTTDNNDISYEYLLERAFKIINKEQGWRTGNSKVTISVPHIHVARIGTRRTAFVNFESMCKALNRQEKHLHNYFAVELGTTASIDSRHALIIKGRFQGRHLETVARSYINEYVLCKACRSSNTKLQKSDRLTMIQCLDCNSQRSVAAIKTCTQTKTNHN